MVKVMESPSILPSVMVDLPIIELVVSPVTLLPSTLKTKVRSMDPLGPSAVAFHVPLMSAAMAVAAITASNAIRRFMGFLSRSLGCMVKLYQLKHALPPSSPVRRRCVLAIVFRHQDAHFLQLLD